MTYNVITSYVMTYEVMTYDVPTYDAMTFDVITYDVITYDVMTYDVNKQECLRILRNIIGYIWKRNLNKLPKFKIARNSEICTDILNKNCFPKKHFSSTLH